jgi:hypothetical protein
MKPAAPIGSYRIRWANVRHRNGGRWSTERMCIAERHHRWFGFWSFWWPIEGDGWHFNEASAASDIERDKLLRTPLPGPIIIGDGK